MQSVRVAFVVSELTPYAKTGGLADVGEALSRALAELGHDVRVFVPLYDTIDRDGLSIEKRFETEAFDLWEGTLPRSKVPVYFVDCPRFFSRGSLYTNDPDEPLRFALFCHAVVQSCQRLVFAPQIFHLNDWQTSLVPVLLETTYAWDRLFEGAKTVLTIHNLGYQGVFGAEAIERMDIPDSSHFDEHDRGAGVVNLLKTGISHADHLTTVSPTYAREIQTEEQGFGLDGLLRHRSGRLTGILNGVDYGEWDPENDEHIPYRYSAETIRLKKQNKVKLLQELGLASSSPDADPPLIGMVSRLSAQKGIELLPRALPDFLARHDSSLAVLGTGERAYEEFFSMLEKRFPGRVRFYRGFNNRLAHWIEAGADMFLMPSRYEPCGLNQMYSLRYGTVPVVRKTGGLADSVQQFDPATGEGHGIVFEHYTASGVQWGLERAIELYGDTASWDRMVQNAMACDFSWAGPAARYSDIYRELLIH